MGGYKELIEIDPNAESITIVDGDRSVDDSGRVSVGRDKAGESYEKIILISDTDTITE